ncbi:hypothetical protein LSS_02267 [Leptospira santarosai serovar Shermani str. LT 821]|uniref:Uncharacterized protein n=1 Tax=Leptospira santarosai serovar Shermani str. LT 821 TaxID=758847 RepID=K8YE92_9LEPT|nr:hypothetical protein LSS_02267 [Leptospira santarosai serovar Shermani str. LT 821]
MRFLNYRFNSLGVLTSEILGQVRSMESKGPF